MTIRLGSLVVVIGILAAQSARSAEPAKPQNPQSPAAVAAMKDYEKAINEAEDAYRQRRIVAERKLVASLKGPMMAATKAGNLADANAISAQIDAAQARIQDLTNPSKPAAKQVEYTVLFLHWKNGQTKRWLLVDGTVVTPGGRPGKWERKGDRIVSDFGSGAKETLTVSADGKTVSGGNTTGDVIQGEVLGTNLDGAETPPAK